jgi:hypothetical protein
MMRRGMINHWEGRSGISPLDVDPLPRVPGEGEVLTFGTALNPYDHRTGSQLGISLIWRNHDLSSYRIILGDADPHDLSWPIWVSGQGVF